MIQFIQRQHMEELLNTDNDIVIDSFCQRSEYYVEHLDDIRKWFELNMENYKIPEDDELVVHIRETDYIQIGKLLSEEYYVEHIKNTGLKKVTIVTDNCQSSFVKKLRDSGCRVLSTERVNNFELKNNDTIMKDYIYMLHAKHLLLSQSTFSWWPAFLGDNEQVIFPVSDNPNSMWKMNPYKNNVDLFVNKFKRVII
jgi:hypothetical protein